MKLQYRHYEDVKEPTIIVQPEVNLANFIERARPQAESPTRDICLGKFQCEIDADILDDPGEIWIGNDQPEPDNSP